MRREVDHRERSKPVVVAVAVEGNDGGRPGRRVRRCLCVFARGGCKDVRLYFPREAHFCFLPTASCVAATVLESTLAFKHIVLVVPVAVPVVAAAAHSRPLVFR